MAMIRMNLEQIKQELERPEIKKMILEAADAPVNLSDPDAPELTELLVTGKVRPVGRPKKDIVMEGIYVRLEPKTIKKLRSSGRGWQGRLRSKVNEWVSLGAL
jgi:uncharacterized protein (DUF4415 family)